MKRSLGAEEWIRRGLGVAVLVGRDRHRFRMGSGNSAADFAGQHAGIEQRLVDRVRPPRCCFSDDRLRKPPMHDCGGGESVHGDGGSRGTATADPIGERRDFPSLDGAVAWLNSPPLTRDGLKGKVVLVDFWTYSCINCLRAIPYVEAWAEKYKNDGLVVIGVHTPEFAFEKDQGNVAKAVRDLKITYPVAIDSNYAIWKAFNNEYWPAHYFIDAQGKIRYHHFGEGEYDKSEEVIQQLLKEGNATVKASGIVQVNGAGAQAAADLSDVQSPETYIGYARQQNYVSPETDSAGCAGNYTRLRAG